MSAINIVILVSVGVLVIANMVFSAFSVKFVMNLLKRCEGMMKQVTDQEYMTLNNVCESYKGVCDSYHQAHDILQRTFDNNK